MSTIKTNYSALYTLIIVFFFWGFFAAGNSIFIPFCKHYFSLDQFQSQLVDFAFYTAYYMGALILFAVSSRIGSDLVGSWGYKRSIVYGLLFSAVGAVAMICAVLANVYIGLLIGLFIVALGFSLQQTAANPFAMLLGDPKTGSSRINLGGGVNSFGTTIGPVLIGIALFGGAAKISNDSIASLNLNSVVYLYAAVGVLFLVAAAIFWFSKKVPAGIEKAKMEKAGKSLKTLLIMTALLFMMFVPVFNSYRSTEAVELEQKYEQLAVTETTIAQNEQDRVDTTTLQTQKTQLEQEITDIKEPLERSRMYWLLGALVVMVGGLLFIKQRAQKSPEGWGAMQYPQLTLGMLALFLYVGVEVAIGSNLGELLHLESFGGYQSSEISPFVSMYWGSLMIGRWSAAVMAFELKKLTKIIALVAAPLLAFAVVIGFNSLSGNDMSVLYYYVLCVCIQIAAFIVCRNSPSISLFVFACLGILAICIGLFSTGMTAVYAILSGGLFCSIMWSVIFTLSLSGLGKYTSQGSAFLVMMILGGGIIPPIQGKLTDIIGVHHSYVVAVVCFSYIAFYALLSRRILRKQSVNLDAE